ncbi:aspartic proteinase CDR1-like [Malania oleifera]|uniref:aspartic proteinase CDR1-like n=1 Tax=Malania oleifera TaxID=397392 RepID=UPI0025ADD2BB|nr:aspartic proteinase CDR1-like [Malania oleifera]
MAIIPTTTTTPSHLSFALLLTISILASFSSLPESHAGGGFTVNLIHRDSPNSPLYNPTDTLFARVSNALLRSTKRAKTLSQTPSPGLSDIINSGGVYLMNISIGSKRVPVLGITDTASDLVWTQCKPCKKCFLQAYPLFDPTTSSTYQVVSCGSKICSAMNKRSTFCTGANCGYQMGYGDGISSRGILSTDQISLGGSNTLPHAVFGCGIENSYEPSGQNGTGVIGLARGADSLISQLDSIIDGKFSYCLVDIYNSGGFSKMRFGSETEFSGAGVISTPLFSQSGNNFYYVRLDAISVGNIMVTNSDVLSPSCPRSSSSVGNIIIDTGTTLPHLINKFHDSLLLVVNKSKELQNLRRVEDPTRTLDLCYRSKEIVGPTLTAHFACGANVTLSPSHAFLKVAEDVLCFGFAKSENLAIWGSTTQMDFSVGYDLRNNKVFFKPTDCTKE